MNRAMILIVDDEAPILHMCERIIANEGYDVATASSGEEALEIIRKRAPDLLITDIRMPGMSGTELLKEALSLHPDISVAMISGYSSQELVLETMKEGAQGFIFKPFTGAELKSTIRRLLKRSRMIKEKISSKTCEKEKG